MSNIPILPYPHVQTRYLLWKWLFLVPKCRFSYENPQFPAQLRTWQIRFFLCGPTLNLCGWGDGWKWQNSAVTGKAVMVAFAFCSPFIPLHTIPVFQRRPGCFGVQIWQMEQPCTTWGGFLLRDKVNVWETLEGHLWSLAVIPGYLKERFKFRFQGCAVGCEPRVSYTHGLKVSSPKGSFTIVPLSPCSLPENSTDLKL